MGVSNLAMVNFGSVNWTEKLKRKPLWATEMRPGFMSRYSIEFSLEKPFRGKRLIFYNLWSFTWRVF